MDCDDVQDREGVIEGRHTDFTASRAKEPRLLEGVQTPSAMPTSIPDESANITEEQG